jgi:integrase
VEVSSIALTPRTVADAESPRLTPRTVADAEPPSDKPYRMIWDEKLSGFGLQITRNGVKTWVLRYRVRGTGEQRQFKIGRVETFELGSARVRAKKLLQDIAGGADPAGDLAELRAAPDCNGLFDKYITDHLPTKRASSARDDKGMIEAYLRPELGTKKVAAVTFDDLSTLHRKIAEGKLAKRKRPAPFRANRVASLVSKIFNLAIRWGYRTDNPAKGIERRVEDRRERYLKPPELKRLVAALDDHADEQSANIIWLCLLTGARRGEVLRMQWDQIDFHGRKWTKPSAHTKQQKEHKLTLSSPSLKLLARIKEKSGDNPYVFPAPRSDSETPYQSDVKGFWAKLLDEAKLDPDIRLHDLRHHHASMIANRPGASLLEIGDVLGHTNPRTTARYTHLFDSSQRRVVDAVAAEIDAIRTGKPTAEVHELRKKPRR